MAARVTSSHFSHNGERKVIEPRIIGVTVRGDTETGDRQTHELPEKFNYRT